MAEINITKKQSSKVPWLLGAVVLAALIWFLAMRNDGTATTTARGGAYDTNSAAGTLAPSRDSSMMRTEPLRNSPPR